MTGVKSALLTMGLDTAALTTCVSLAEKKRRELQAAK
jgi:hypothetical protein